MRRNFESPMESENNLKIGDYICDDELNAANQRWTVLDCLTDKIYHISDCEFAKGLSSKNIKLKGQFIQIGNNDKIWIDGIWKKLF